MRAVQSVLSLNQMTWQHVCRANIRPEKDFTFDLCDFSSSSHMFLNSAFNRVCLYEEVGVSVWHIIAVCKGQIIHLTGSTVNIISRHIPSHRAKFGAGQRVWDIQKANTHSQPQRQIKRVDLAQSSAVGTEWIQMSYSGCASIIWMYNTDYTLKVHSHSLSHVSAVLRQFLPVEATFCLMVSSLSWPVMAWHTYLNKRFCTVFTCVRCRPGARITNRVKLNLVGK